ncbi:hypothetical protein [Flavobacterium chungangense]|uniref:hypothetical protein n=1 Tax=Flavobacterium chungangense TaxID=554283 RepID=UPI001F3962F6|nr:hypothetical protein [Flavobacterium chungangense]
MLSTSVVLSFLLLFPRIDITTCGNGLMAAKAGTVTQISSSKIVIGEREYLVTPKEVKAEHCPFFPSKIAGRK